jgi:aminocarboxymuconate-semialdehyde decarboxylase
MASLIDWHSHHAAPELAELCQELGVRKPGVDPYDTADFDERRRALDEVGIDLQLICQTATAGDALPVADAMSLVRASNDAIADRISMHPDRFTGAVTISVRDVEGSGAELDRMAPRGFRAVLMYPQVNGEFLADRPECDPIFAKIAGLGLPIFMHGGGNLGADESMRHLEDEGAGVAASVFADAAVTECAMRLIAAGIFDRYPSIRVVVRSGGGGLPLLLKKMSWLHKGNGEARKYSELFVEHFLVDCASVNARTIQFFIDALGERCVVFGSDYCGGLGPLSRGVAAVNEHPNPPYVRAVTVTERNSRELLHV